MDSDHMYNGAVILASVAFFKAFAEICTRCTPPSIEPRVRQRYRNICVSFVHSLVSGVWAVLCFHLEPTMTDDLINVRTPLAQTLVAFSYGYFLHDSIDMFMHPNKGFYELLLHHGVIGAAFGIALYSHLYIGYAALALVIELHNVFLHIRQLLNFHGYTMSNDVYRVNSFVNLMALVLIRVGTCVYMTRWLVTNADAVPPVPFAIGSFGMLVINIMNVFLFYRLVSADWLTAKQKNEKVDNGVKQARNVAATRW